MAEAKYSWLDFLLTVMGLGFLLLDIVLDILAVVNFYQDGAYVSLVILVLLLVGSSVLAQAFSWLWYNVEVYEEFREEPVVRSLSLSPGKVKLLHVLQCGIYFRLCKLACVPFYNKPLAPLVFFVFLCMYYKNRKLNVLRE